MPDETNSALLDEERRLASHREVKASIDDDMNARIRRGRLKSSQRNRSSWPVWLAN
jgi:hypothetical protein